MTRDLDAQFIELRRAYIAQNFESLNSQQRTAVLKTQGPLLLLAGAGSGKTTVLIHRIENILRFGCGSDSDFVPAYITSQTLELLQNCVNHKIADASADFACKVNVPYPSGILAITFTNKAANELKSRLSNKLGEEGNSVWAMTFHSACCRILRRDIHRLGFDPNFTIYDAADSERLMKDILKEKDLDDKIFPPKSMLNYISKAKDEMQSPEDFSKSAAFSKDYRKTVAAQCYTIYQKKLQAANALDFDDLIYHTVKLLQNDSETREYYQRKFKYVLVDEYQDTNHAQYLLTALLAGGYGNLCVVGDDDQSIYKFRGATIRNILEFEKNFPGAQLIRLEQNYRSTENILTAANAVISNNHSRKGKTLWTGNSTGEKLIIHEAENEYGEADYIAGDILSRHKSEPFSAFAVLYRTNAQSNSIERSFTSNGIPYKIIGGTRFFERAEVKDIIAYLTIIDNPNDDLRLKRILNVPARGIGAKTLEYAERIALSEGFSLYKVFQHAKDYPALERAAGKLSSFLALIESLRSRMNQIELTEFYENVLSETGYKDMLESKNTVEDAVRLENILELKSNILAYTEKNDSPSLRGFLEEISLYTDLERYNSEEDSVVMMTIHSAKGLEFEHVYLAGAEEGLFPSARSCDEPEDLEEERRLCYVAITRAKKTFIATYTKQRLLYGRTTNNLPSRFLKEIPDDCALRRELPKQYSGNHDWGYNGTDWNFRSYEPQRPSYSSSNRATATNSTKSVQRGSSFSPEKSGNSSCAKKAPNIDYQTGNMVIHDAFGKGMVLSTMKMGSDTLLEVAFDNFGTKRLLANSASSHMKKI